MPGPAEIVVIVVISVTALIVALGLVLWRRARAAGPQRGRPAHRGPDPNLVEEDLRTLLGQQRIGAGGGELLRDDRLDELARHHAHWMSVHGRLTAVDDQGRDVTGRREDLHPDLEGPLQEILASLEPAGVDESAAAAGLCGQLGDPEAWTAGEGRCAGVGVAAAGGRLWTCVVVWNPEDGAA